MIRKIYKTISHKEKKISSENSTKKTNVIKVFFNENIVEDDINKGITVGFCNKERDINYENHLKNVFTEEDEIISKYNVGKTKTLTQAYNEIIKEAKNDIIILLHNDCEFIEYETYKGKINAIIKTLFLKNPEYGIIGCIGGNGITRENPSWGNISAEGHWVQGYKNKSDEYIERGSLKKFSIAVNEVLVCDGFCLMLNRKKIKTLFDETNHSFNFYDMDICLSNHIRGVKIGATKAILIKHKSEGNYNNQYKKDKEWFLKKWDFLLPLTKKNTIIKI